MATQFTKTCLCVLLLAFFTLARSHRFSNHFYFQAIGGNPESNTPSSNPEDRDIVTSQEASGVDSFLNNLKNDVPKYNLKPKDNSETDSEDRTKIYNDDGTPNEDRAGLISYLTTTISSGSNDRAAVQLLSVDDFLSAMKGSKPRYNSPDDRGRTLDDNPTDSSQVTPNLPSEPYPSGLPTPVVTNPEGFVVIRDNGAVFLRHGKTPNAVNQNEIDLGDKDKDYDGDGSFVEPLVQDKPFEGPWLGNGDDATTSSSGLPSDSSPSSSVAGNNEDNDAENKEAVAANGVFCNAPNGLSFCDYYTNCFFTLHTQCQSSDDFLGEKAWSLCPLTQASRVTTTSQLLRGYLDSTDQCTSQSLQAVAGSSSCDEVNQVLKNSLLLEGEDNAPCRLLGNQLCDVLADPVAGVELANIYILHGNSKLKILMRFRNIAIHTCRNALSAALIEALK